MENIKIKTESFNNEIVMGRVFQRSLVEMQKRIKGVTSIIPYKDKSDQQLIRYKKNGETYYLSVYDPKNMTAADWERVERIISDK